MDKLWAPWRIKYITAAKKTKQCIFCRAAKSAKAEYVVFKTKYSICLLNIFPYNNGHLMVAPRRHKADISKLSDKESIDLLQSLKRAKKLLDKTLKPDGYNIGMNLSAAAGAGFPGHLHVHIVPRWKGDTNFMPVACATKIISQSLDELYKILKNAQSNTN
ncbi:MAG: HIT domain-containing protein [Candidatus Omnitrophica bacterium]|jgi:ATP adenylyltransferase|nr:HIT domain-containing protein [Candidatus Omnitrophota bacterium]